MEEKMELFISKSAGKPIYEQLEIQIKDLILSGKLRPGDPLPSMRELAKDLKISLITTKRTYEDLEREGFIVSMVGKGSFVSDTDFGFLSEYKLNEIESLLSKAVEEAKACGVSLQELIDIVSIFYEGREK